MAFVNGDVFTSSNNASKQTAKASEQEEAQSKKSN